MTKISSILWGLRQRVIRYNNNLEENDEEEKEPINF